MATKDQTYVEVPYVKMIRETDAAVLLEFEGGDEKWLPLSQLEDRMQDFPKNGKVSVKKWIADANELEY